MNSDPGTNEKSPNNRWRDSVKKFYFKHPYVIAIGSIVVLMVIGSILINLSNSKTEFSNTDAPVNIDQGISSESASKDMVSGVETAPDAADSQIPFDVSKIIYAGNISLYTDDYQNTFEKIGQYAVELGGFVQDSSSSYGSEDQNTAAATGYIIIRVPAEKFTEAMKEIQKLGSPINSSVSSTNISQQYQDIQGQLNNLKIQEARLQEYLKSAENINDLLLIETELNRIRTEIDNRTTMIRNWDQEINYSTIYVSLIEQKLATSSVQSPFENILKQISEGFIASINLILNIFSGLIVWIFRLLPFAAIIGVGYFIYRRVKKKK
ncbi:DUF4349 domain-containing protein [Acetobacterium bakii]|uniref:DUF4349 domain-containing protein n=1 Tax=Acetobacterium bakii TaxID=52689 RepID=A0A0L6TWQ4_9FIRM|nr:DUF4349 domain-containing protein [Acetobacterium bakii]KNZ40497.1 hypothetical protein AKG39_17320 [Acetobacterium bakii]